MLGSITEPVRVRVVSRVPSKSRDKRGERIDPSCAFAKPSTCQAKQGDWQVLTYVLYSIYATTSDQGMSWTHQC